MNLLEIWQVYKIRQHDSTCVQNPLPWQLKQEQCLFVEKRKANFLYKCFKLEAAQFTSLLKLTDILWSEISAKYRLLSINNRFCNLKQKVIVIILVVMATEFEEKWNLTEELYWPAKFQTNRTINFPYIKFLLFHCFLVVQHLWRHTGSHFSEDEVWNQRRPCLWLRASISQEPVGVWRSLMAHSFGYFMLFHLSTTCTKLRIPL